MLIFKFNPKDICNIYCNEPYKIHESCLGTFENSTELIKPEDNQKILPFKQLLLGPYENTNDPREKRTFRFAAISPPEQKDFIANNWPGIV
jgi:hypothetical protein